MPDTYSSKVFLCFNLLCLCAAMVLSAYWIYVFVLNEDLCTVDYKKYLIHEKDVFPGFSICMNDPISNEKLKKRNATFNSSEYLKFLEGEIFDPKMTLIDYSTIIRNITDFIEVEFIRYRNIENDIPIMPLWAYN